jgi:hypothetical protein
VTWFAFRNGHPDIEAAGLEEKQLVGALFHGYSTKAQADQHPNSVNPIQQSFLFSLDAQHAGHAAASDVSGGLNAIGDLAHRLTESQTWVRVGEAMAGLLLLYVGLKALTSGTAAGTAAGSVGRAGKRVGKIVAEGAL